MQHPTKDFPDMRLSITVYGKLAILHILILYSLHAQNTPIQMRTLAVQDYEMLSYRNIVAGEHYQNFIVVSRLLKKDELAIYIGKYTLGSKTLMPVHYTNFQRQFSVDLKNGRLIGGFGDYEKEFRSENRYGEVYFTIDMDYIKNTAVFRSKIWDGFDTMTKTVRVKLVPGYPCWDLLSLVWVGARFLDTQSKGVFYGIYPSVVKQAVPVTVRFLGKETVTTPAGVFPTIRLSVSVVDPFLANLLDNYIREMSIWIEDSPRALVIKSMSPEDNYLLEKIDTWRDK